MPYLIRFAIIAALLIGAAYVARWTSAAIRETTALHCARVSIGTDSAIAECFIAQGLPVPGDIGGAE